MHFPLAARLVHVMGNAAQIFCADLPIQKSCRGRPVLVSQELSSSLESMPFQVPLRVKATLSRPPVIQHTRIYDICRMKSMG